MFQKVLVLNRGEIACRIMRTLKRMQVPSVAVYSEADAQSLHVAQADEAVCLGGTAVRESYLNKARILQVLKQVGADAVHPGYGFYSENAEFAEALEPLGVTFIGPRPEHLRTFGLKHAAKELAARAAVPLVPGSSLLSDVEHACRAADHVGYPVMLKSTAGGGGIGLTRVADEASLRAAFNSVVDLSTNNFANGGVFVEKLIERGRHIEVQVFGDGKGNVVHLGERDCSVQRRNQKVIEETPAPCLGADTRAALLAAAVRLMQSVSYASAGTVEFIYDCDTEAFYFLEVNTRLQVEHGVTEEVTGVDLVEWMIRLATDDALPELKSYQHTPQGHSIQARVYAEAPRNAFRPSSGLLTAADFPKDVRVDTWVEAGVDVPAFYDPLLAKLIVKADDRSAALDQLARALEQVQLSGIETNVDYLCDIARSPIFRQGGVTTGFTGELVAAGRGIEVLAPGTQSTIQDYPGRTGYWHIGVPPSGPMDALSLRLGNRVLGNPDGAPALEMTVSGPNLRFLEATTIALTGADLGATLNGEPVALYEPVAITAGDRLKLSTPQGPGLRGYLCVKGGFQVPNYLGSASTFTLGGFGGHGGRALRVGDVLRLAQTTQHTKASSVPPEQRPKLTHAWELGVLYGPHGAPDFFTPADMEMFFSTPWEVHYNSARTGVRLVGPKPEWARKDGGEAGLHPSNIHDCPYAVGAIDFTGDMPIILGPDGPSLGGFVCPATVIKSELWKLGQLKPKDTVRFVPVTRTEAERQSRAQDALVMRGTPADSRLRPSSPGSPIVLRRTSNDPHDEMVIRASGDRAVLVEFGPMELDLRLRFRAHAMMQGILAATQPAILEVTPGIRSVQVQFDPERLPLGQLITLLEEIKAALPDLSNAGVPSRVVHLPLSWDDEATQLAIKKYTELVRKDAPWAPSNIEFIRRINGLDSIEQVRDIVFSASYMVLGLGDVYLGAPVATPVDPRHRLVTTKYNPARTWTPENAVGIGGAYLCIYGMEGPGGYQFVGRTLQVFNRFRITEDFEADKPWLLRFFDQLRFYPVSHAELIELRRAFVAGRFKLRVSEESFKLGEYEQFLRDNQASIQSFKRRQQAAFEAERQRWAQAAPAATLEVASAADPIATPSPPNSEPIHAPVPGSIWKALKAPGQRVEVGEALFILESMKMEVPVEAPASGQLVGSLGQEGQAVNAGDILGYISQAGS